MPDQQRTFGEDVGLEPTVPPAESLPSDYIDHATCGLCGDEFEQSEVIETPDCTNEDGDTGGDFYCASCFDDTYANCYACNIFVPQEWADNHNGYCCECYDERFTNCIHCNETLSHADGEVFTDENGFAGPYCQSCYDERYYRCEDCGCEVHQDHVISSEHGNTYCDSCYNDRFVHCDDCGIEVERDDAYYSSEWYCEDCRPEEEEEDNDFTGSCDCDACTGRSRPTPSLRTPRPDPYAPRPYRSQSQADESDPTGCAYTSYSWDFAPRPHTHPTEEEGDAAFAEIGSRRTYGVEIETSRCDDFRELRRHTIFGAKRDYSITGREFVSPKLSGDSGLQVITDLCELARQRNFAINTSCGLHVHFGIADLSLEQRAALVLAYQQTYEVWCAFVPQSRVDCRWNKPTNFDDYTVREYTHTERSWESWCNSLDRETWINFAAWMRHKTVESRLHTGSINARKINNWVKANIRFIDTVIGLTIEDVQTTFAGKSRQEKFNYVTDCWGDSDLTAYYLYRSRKFGNALRSVDPLQMSNMELAS